jgi:hypothetical protein
MTKPKPDVLTLERAVVHIFDYLSDRILAADGEPVPLLELAMGQIQDLTSTLNIITNDPRQPSGSE